MNPRSELCISSLEYLEKLLKARLHMLGSGPLPCAEEHALMELRAELRQRRREEAVPAPSDTVTAPGKRLGAEYHFADPRAAAYGIRLSPDFHELPYTELCARVAAQYRELDIKGLPFPEPQDPNAVIFKCLCGGVFMRFAFLFDVALGHTSDCSSLPRAGEGASEP